MTATTIQVAPGGLYLNAQGDEITTHSMLSAFTRCPNSARYKYAERLKPRFIDDKDKPLHRGTWFHKLLECHYSGGDWRKLHRKLSNEYDNLFDEEKDALGNLPVEMASLMRAYLWHYGADKDDPFHGWIVHETEKTLECRWPDGRGVYRMRLDMLVEDQFGLWIVDHKTHKRLPDTGFRLRDKANALYIWCAINNDIPVLGFIWNYVKAKAPTIPALVDVARVPRLSNVAIETDYPTAIRAIRAYGLDKNRYLPMLRDLHARRWHPDAIQSSPFFRRDTLERDDALIDRVVRSAMRTRDRMHGYDFTDLDTVERTVDRSCGWCRYEGLCTVELYNGTDAPQAGNIRRQQFKVGDPLDYYNDEREVVDNT